MGCLALQKTRVRHCFRTHRNPIPNESPFPSTIACQRSDTDLSLFRHLLCTAGCAARRGWRPDIEKSSRPISWKPLRPVEENSRSSLEMFLRIVRIKSPPPNSVFLAQTAPHPFLEKSWQHFQLLNARSRRSSFTAVSTPIATRAQNERRSEKIGKEKKNEEKRNS